MSIITLNSKRSKVIFYLLLSVAIAATINAALYIFLSTRKSDKVLYIVENDRWIFMPHGNLEKATYWNNDSISTWTLNWDNDNKAIILDDGTRLRAVEEPIEFEAVNGLKRLTVLEIYIDAIKITR